MIWRGTHTCTRNEAVIRNETSGLAAVAAEVRLTTTGGPARARPACRGTPPLRARAESRSWANSTATNRRSRPRCTAQATIAREAPPSFCLFLCLSSLAPTTDPARYGEVFPAQQKASRWGETGVMVGDDAPMDVELVSHDGVRHCWRRLRHHALICLPLTQTAGCFACAGDHVGALLAVQRRAADDPEFWILQLTPVPRAHGEDRAAVPPVRCTQTHQM